METVFEIEQEWVLSPNSFPWITVTSMGLAHKALCCCVRYLFCYDDKGDDLQIAPC